MGARVQKVRALLFLKDFNGAYRAKFRYKRQPADIAFHYRGDEYGYGIRSSTRVMASCSAWNHRIQATHFRAMKLAMRGFVRVFCVCEKRYNELGSSLHVV